MVCIERDERLLSLTHFSKTRRYGVSPSFSMDPKSSLPICGQLLSVTATIRNCPKQLPSAMNTPGTISCHLSCRLLLPPFSEIQYLSITGFGLTRKQSTVNFAPFCLFCLNNHQTQSDACRSVCRTFEEHTNWCFRKIRSRQWLATSIALSAIHTSNRCVYWSIRLRLPTCAAGWVLRSYRTWPGRMFPAQLWWCRMP